jgi:protoporphyrinogen oxidase
VLRRTYAEMGPAGGLAWSHPLTATLLGGEIAPLDSPLSLLRFDGLPVVARLRMGATLAALRLLGSPGLLEGRAAGPWLRRWMGRSAYDRIWRPLFEGKFGTAAEDVAMPWFWARVRDRSASLGYPSGGFRGLYEAMAARIGVSGGSIRLNAVVEAVERAGTGYSIRGHEVDGGFEARHDAVISTLPAGAIARLAPELPDSWRTAYGSVRSRTAQCLVLELDRPLTNSYWLNVNDPGYPFIVVVEHTNMRSPVEYGGRHILYLANYRDRSDPRLALGADELTDVFVPHLGRINPAFDTSWITGKWLFDIRDAQPIVGTDFRRQIPPFETPLAGLYVATIAQVYPHDRGQNYALELGERLAAKLLASEPGPLGPFGAAGE